MIDYKELIEYIHYICFRQRKFDIEEIISACQNENETLKVLLQWSYI